MGSPNLAIPWRNKREMKNLLNEELIFLFHEANKSTVFGSYLLEKSVQITLILDVNKPLCKTLCLVLEKI